MHQPVPYHAPLGGMETWLLGRKQRSLILKCVKTFLLEAAPRTDVSGNCKHISALLTCSSFGHHLSGRNPSAHRCHHHRIEAAGFQSVEAVSAGLTGDTLVFDDHIFMDQ